MRIAEILTEIDCWPGHHKIGTQPGTGKNKGKPVNKCKKNESLDADQKRAGQVGSKERAKNISPVLTTEPKKHPYNNRLVGENTVKEVAPPGMEDWIKDRKADFKKRYGDRWEEVLYATAWKHKKNESLEEGYGKYYCSTDKRWKERKGPKQTRSS
jgi:hypothetical protein